MKNKDNNIIQKFNKILAIDLGTTSGIAMLDNKLLRTCHFTTKSYKEFGVKLTEILYGFNPDIIVCSQTNSYGHFNASRKMHMLFGIVCYITECKNIPSIELNDTQARKSVLGKGYKKDQAHIKLLDLFPEFLNKTPDELDAIILAKGWQNLSLI